MRFHPRPKARAFPTPESYNWQKREPSKQSCDDARLTQQIKAIWYTNRHCYGRPRILAELKAQGICISQKRVARLMKVAHITVTPPGARKPCTIIADATRPVFANRLARDFMTTAYLFKTRSYNLQVKVLIDLRKGILP